MTPEDKAKKDALLSSLGYGQAEPEPAEIAGDQESLRVFMARLQEIGVAGDQLNAAIKASGQLGVDARKMIWDLIKLHRSGSTIDPVYYGRNEKGQLTANSPYTWKKGCKSPNPLGRARTRIGIWGRFCQIMQMTEPDLDTLLQDNKITMADKAAIRLCLKMVNDGAWLPMQEAINREEGKVQEKVQIEAPPVPIKFVETPGRAQPDLEDTGTEGEDD